MEKNEILKKIKLINEYMLKKRDAQKARMSDSHIIEIEDFIVRINDELMELRDSQL